MHVKCPMINSVSLFALRQFPDLCMLVGKNKLVRQVRQVVLISRFMVSRLLVGKNKLVGQVRQVVLISRFMVSRLLVRQVVKQWPNGKQFFPIRVS